MEQSILENSKGATYMSFILDIEIVIKKDGAKVNLAETKAKSQGSKKKDGASKEPYNSSRNQDVKVYAVSQSPRKSIFELPMGNDEESDLSESKKVPNAKIDRFEKTKNKPVSKSDSNENKITQNKENVSENIQEKIGSIDIEQTPIPDGENLVSNNVRPKKKKISKAAKKAKVFKGNIEPIDFLECNRIFMCNYFKIPISRKKRNFEINHRSSDSKVIESEENASKVNGMGQKSLSTEKLDKKTYTNRRLRTFWKKKSSSLVRQDSTLDKYSLGDHNAINTSQTEANECEKDKLNTIETSNGRTTGKKNTMKRKYLINALKFTDYKANSQSRRNIETSNIDDNQNSKSECSNIQLEQEITSTVLQKSKSMPKIKEIMRFQIVDCAKSDINQHQHYKAYKKKSFSFIRALKNKTHSKTCTAKEGLCGLQISCFEDVDFVLAPESNIENGSNPINNYGDSIYILKEENLPDLEKHTHTNYEVLVDRTSIETDNINNTVEEIACSEIGKSKNSSPVLEEKFSSNTINITVLKTNETDGKCDSITAVNTEKCLCIQNDALKSLQTSLEGEPDTCLTIPQINVSRPVSEKSYLTESKVKLRGNSRSESERKNCDEKDLETVPKFSSDNSLGERLAQKCGICSQTAEQTEKKGQKSRKSKTSKFEILHSYMKNVTNKFR